MQIEELSEFIGRKDGLHKVWEIQRNNIILLLKRYGTFCQWNEIVLERDSEKVYRIQYERYFKDGENVGKRRETFFGELLRGYEGDQFSFIEYLESMNEQQDFPDREWLVAQGLEERFADIYREQAKRIFEA